MSTKKDTKNTRIEIERHKSKGGYNNDYIPL